MTDKNKRRVPMIEDKRSEIEKSIDQFDTKLGMVQEIDPENRRFFQDLSQLCRDISNENINLKVEVSRLRNELKEAIDDLRDLRDKFYDHKDRGW